MTDKQKERYDRHLILPQIGEAGQNKLLGAKVLVVGAGGLGSPVLLYLAAAGVGTLGIVDDDTVSLSNLQRQILYSENECGLSKSIMAGNKLKKLNTDIKIDTYPLKLDADNAEEIISKYNIVIGATDNFESRKKIDLVSRKYGIPFIHGSIGEFEGQLTVFNYLGGPSYSDLFSETPNESTMPLGVMGVLPGVIGSLQACEAIKIICGIGKVLSGRLLIYNALDARFNEIGF